MEAIPRVRIPKSLQYSKIYSKRDEIAALDCKSKDGGKQASIAPVPASNASESDVRGLTTGTPCDPNGAPSDTSQMENSFNTQSSNISGMKAALKGMMQSESFTQGDTQNQALGYSSRCPSSTNVSSADTRPVLSRVTVDYLELEKQHLRSTARQLAKAAGKKQQNAELVLCQCDCYREDGVMVNERIVQFQHITSSNTTQVCCKYCDTWQHLSCYGYTGDSDSRLPVNHVCYQCLLGDAEDDTLEKLAKLAQKRRGMHFALKNGLRTQRDFLAETGKPWSIFPLTFPFC